MLKSSYGAWGMLEAVKKKESFKSINVGAERALRDALLKKIRLDLATLLLFATLARAIESSKPKANPQKHRS